MLYRVPGFVAVVALLLTTVFSSESSAQWRGRGQLSQRGMRIIGHGFSAGYHWRNPGHDSSYYCPYSEHNSRLISQEYGYSTGNPYSRNAWQQPGIPVSQYAPSTPVDAESISNGEQAPPPVAPGDSQSNGQESESSEPDSNGSNESSNYGEFDSTDSYGSHSNSTDFIPAGYLKRGH